MRCLEIRIEGKVQGVWFRKYTKSCADRLGIIGEVKNCADGSVLCIAQGGNEVMDEFLVHCRTGSPLSEVKNVTTTEHPPIPAASFEIIG